MRTQKGDMMPTGSDPVDHDASNSATMSGVPLSWDDFTRRLAESLGRMAIESFLILSLPADVAGVRAYVQFAHWAHDASQGLRTEAAGNKNLPGTRPLTPAQEERLEALAWQCPDTDSAVGNYIRDWPMPAPFAEVAAVAVRTLREVYGVAEPAELRFRYALFGSGDVADLALGLEPEERPLRPRSKPSRRPSAGTLSPIVEQGLRRWLRVDRLERDADSDYPIRVGSALIFVRVVEDELPMIAIFSTILAGVEEGPALFAALDDINRRIRFARAFSIGRTILVATELPVVDITADQIAFACMQLGSLADHLDDVLHGRFGGGFAFEGRPTLVN